MAVILQFDRFGGPEVLSFRDVPVPVPGPGEVVYAVKAFALNRGDLFWMEDRYYSSPALPARVGQEAFGIVEAVGAGVTGLAPGDAVCSLVQGDGKYCVNGEFAVSLARDLARWTGEDDPVAGCAMWSQALTAYYPMVELGRVGPGCTVLVTAASSTAGNGAVQMAKLCGARVIATSRRLDKRDFLLGIGADAVIATDGLDLAAQVTELTDGHGVDLVYDTVAGPMMPRYFDCLAPWAQIYIVGALSDDLNLSGPIMPLIRAGARITGFSVFNHNRDDAQLDRAKRFIGEAIAAGRLTPVVDRVFPFSEAVEAYRYLASGVQRGKVVVRI
nr:zinc-dependent alcohol dehydrogenase family protein [Sphingomonas sp. Y57]